MNNKLTCFDFDGGAVRVLEKSAAPWFVAADVCRVLEIANSRDAVGSLDEDEKADVGIADVSSNGVVQRRAVSIISESGLYALIFKSRKPAAKKFRKWVTSEVLPAIRRTGSYAQQEEAQYVLRHCLEVEVQSTQTELANVMYLTAEGGYKLDRARAVAALAGRRMEAVRLRMELSGLFMKAPQPDEQAELGLVAVG